MSRSIALGLVAVVAAFALAFGIGKAAGGKDATAGVKAAAIKVAGAPAVQSVELGGSVPALKSAPAKKAKKKTTKKSTSNSSSTSESNSNNSNNSNNSTTPPKVTPPKVTPPKVTPPKVTPPPVTGNGDEGDAPVTGGNEDG